MEIKREYSGFSQQGNRFIPNYTGSGQSFPILKPGIYTMHYDQRTGMFWFEEFLARHDRLLDLPSPEYTRVVTEMNHFMSPKVKAKFDQMGFLKKRSALLYGPPGTGKTCIVNRVMQNVIQDGGVVIFANKEIGLLKHAFEILTSTQPDILTMVIMEEFEKLARSEESALLSLLDGQIQKPNTLYLATTNYIEKVPKRLYRPGRFSSVIQVGYPNAEARQMFLVTKLGAEFEGLTAWVERTEGLSIDELKEMVQAVEIFEQGFDETLQRLKDTRSLEEENRDEEDCDF